MDERLIRYLLDDMTLDERAAFEEHLAASPADAERIDVLRKMLHVLEGERDHTPEPPLGLAVQTLARTAEYLVANGLSPVATVVPDTCHTEPSSAVIARQYRATYPEEFDHHFLPSWLRRFDVAVAACFGVLIVGLLLVGVEKVRHDGQIYTCQDQLRGVHQALVSYSDVNMGRYPQVGTAAVPNAGSFARELLRSGHLPADSTIVCPAVPAMTAPGTPTKPVGYAYTLGYSTPTGQVHGIIRNVGSNATGDWVPVAADLPVPNSSAHGTGQNVLYTGGMVKFAPSRTAGVNGDDIYVNEAGLVRAGLHRDDAALGRAGDTP